MKAWYLTFTDHAEAETALSIYPAQVSHNHALDVIGTLFTPGSYDEEGNELIAPSAKPGWHVNLVVESLPEQLLPYRVQPITPSRRFAGVPDA